MVFNTKQCEFLELRLRFEQLMEFLFDYSTHTTLDLRIDVECIVVELSQY